MKYFLAKKKVKYPTVNDEWEQKDDIKPVGASRKRPLIKEENEEKLKKKKTKLMKNRKKKAKEAIKTE